MTEVACTGLQPVETLHENEWFSTRNRGGYYTVEYHRRAGVMQAEGALPDEPSDRILTAMGFTLAHPEVDVVIIGTQRPEHMLSNIELIDNRLPISSATVEALHERYDRLSDSWEQRG